MWEEAGPSWELWEVGKFWLIIANCNLSVHKAYLNHTATQGPEQKV